MRSSFLVTGLLFAIACTKDDPAAQTPNPTPVAIDASAPDGSSPPGPNDAGPTDDAAPDGAPPDDGTPYCKSAATAGSAFCVDFEESTDVGDGWKEANTSGDATLTLDTSVAKQKKSAAAKFTSTGDNDGTAAFVQVVQAGGTKSKVIFEFDGYVSFPNGAPTNNTLFVTIAVRTGTSSTGQFFIDMERGAAGWHILTTGTGEEPFLAFSESAWHHFRLSYDGSGAEGVSKLSIDNADVATVSVEKGSAAGDAPATFDNLLIEHLGFDGDTSTSFYIDNVIVRYP